MRFSIALSFCSTLLLASQWTGYAQKTGVAAVAPLPASPAPTSQSNTTVGTPVVGLMGQEGLNATAWVQSAAEARAAAKQAYHIATIQLDKALKDKKWTAAVEQLPPFKKLPPAIILDLDETVLDNSPYQARLVRDDSTYTSESWRSWVSQAAAPALPGAVAFLQYAASKKVQIFYVTNRSVPEEEATRQNLLRLGCPLQGPEDHVLMVSERPEWVSDKTSRRRYVAQNYRVLLLVGDDLNDFVPAKPLSQAARFALTEQYDANWGQKWILLSNPLYGSWEGALFDYRNDLSRQEMLKRKYGALQTLESTAPVTTANPALPATR